MQTVPHEILLVEDNEDHAVLTCEGFKETKVPVSINVVENGVEALAYLRREGKYRLAKRPAVVLLDLNLPMMGGLELLKEVKSDVELRPLPVLVLTTSSSPDDIDAAYRLHANSYLIKPYEYSKTVQMCLSIVEFWLDKAARSTSAQQRGQTPEKGSPEAA